MNMNDFLKIRIIKEYKENEEKEIFTLGINPNNITNFSLNDDMINIVYTMSNSEQSATVYKISVDDGNYLELRENIKGVSLIRCYVTQKEYEDILRELNY